MKKPIGRANDLRKGRVSELGRHYLITACTLNRKPYFNDFHSARNVIQALRHHDTLEQTQMLAFVVMPDHIHWLFTLRNDSLSKIVGSFKSWVSHSLGVKLWQSGFHDRAVRQNESLIAISRYIVANPLRAGLVDRIGDYPHWDAVWLKEYL